MKAFAWVLGLVGAAFMVAAFSPPMVSAEADTVTSAPVTAPAPNLGETDDEAAGKDTCRNCGSGSTGACSGARQCRGTEKECRAKGCKDTGYSSCSTAANVKIC
ncbi:MAG: hypothetical protein RBU30_16365 [Polyangia bacterium]|jgi:hypothetical protein|nr:hypothetical protein [Polyangia bacterium]